MAITLWILVLQVSGGVTGAVYAGYQFAQVYNIDGQALGPDILVTQTH